MLKEEQLNKYRETLEKLRSSLTKEIQEDETSPDFGNESDSFDTETDEAEEFENNLSVADTIRDRLNQVEEALEKIENGTYGICEECGKEIEEKVLQTVPESALCAECKKGHA